MISTRQALKTYPWGWNFGPFCSTTTVFRDMRSPERKCTEWPQTELEHLKSQKYLVYTTYREAHILVRFALRRLERYDQSGFQYIAQFIIPHWLPCQTEKKCQKFKISNFTILSALVETLPRSMHEFWGANLVCSFRGDIVWIFYSHMVPC